MDSCSSSNSDTPKRFTQNIQSFVFGKYNLFKWTIINRLRRLTPRPCLAPARGGAFDGLPSNIINRSIDNFAGQAHISPHLAPSARPRSTPCPNFPQKQINA